MVPERIQSLRIATLLLLLSADLTVEVSISDFRPLGTSLLIAAVWSVLAVVGYFLCPTTKQPQNKPPRWLAVLVLIAMFLPMALEPLFRQWADMGNSLEFQMVYALRNIGLVLAACSAWMVALRTAAVVSIFLILFSISLSEQTATLVSLLGYTVVAICWLLTAYWNVLQPAFRQPSVVLSSERIVRIRRAGYALPLILIFVPTLLFAGYQLMPQEVLQKLGEWLPTSGGTGEFDPYARSGVNDGNEEIAGQNPNSTGMTDSQQFLESPLPSLYDVFNDSYGEPFKPQEHEHSIALDPSLMMKETEKDPADNLRPNRQFSTQRKPSDKKGNPKDRAARAIFEVEGKTPLHVRAVTYSRFDGINWQESTYSNQHALIHKDPDSNWINIEDQTEPTLIHSRLDYNLKMTRPEGSLVPTPPHTTAFRIGRVDRREFFTWAQDRVVRFANRATPASIQIESKSLLLDPQKLREYQFRYSSYAASPEYLELPATLDPRVRELARTIVGNLPHGWQQIEAISQYLQENYALTGNLAPESVKSDPLVDFLFSHRAGPDYQFASAATVMLRTLGYPTRMVAGWYAAPENFDPETSHTPVVAEDVHFWAELRLPTGDWLIVEPSPGYERLTPSPSWMEQLTTSLSALFRWVARHWFPILISFLALLVMVWQRQRCWDLVARTWWAWFPGSNWQQQILRVGKILDQRARWYGFAKKPSQTYAQWLHQYQQGATDVSVLQTFSQWSDWASYGPGSAPNSNLNSQELGRAVLNHFPLNYFRQLKRQQTI